MEHRKKQEDKGRMREMEDKLRVRKREEEDEEGGDVKKIKKERKLHIACYLCDKYRYRSTKTVSLLMPRVRQDRHNTKHSNPLSRRRRLYG